MLRALQPTDMDDSLVAAWLANLVGVERCTKTTAKLYGNTVAAFRTACPATLLGARRPDVDHFLAPAPNPTFNTRLFALRSLYSFLVEKNFRSDDPTEGIRAIEIISAERVPPNLDEMILIIDAARKESPSFYQIRNVAILEVAAGTGIRGTELLSLKVKWTDLQRHVFLKVRLKGGNEVSVVFSDLVAEAIESWLRVRSKFIHGEDDGTLFLSNRGKQMSLRNLEFMVTRYAKVAGIDRNIFPHIFRHYFATQMNDLGIDLKSLQKHFGHKEITTTQEYIHTELALRQETVNAQGERQRARRVELLGAG